MVTKYQRPDRVKGFAMEYLNPFDMPGDAFKKVFGRIKFMDVLTLEVRIKYRAFNDLKDIEIADKSFDIWSDIENNNGNSHFPVLPNFSESGKERFDLLSTHYRDQIEWIPKNDILDSNHIRVRSDQEVIRREVQKRVFFEMKNEGLRVGLLTPPWLPDEWWPPNKIDFDFARDRQQEIEVERNPQFHRWLDHWNELEDGTRTFFYTDPDYEGPMPEGFRGVPDVLLQHYKDNPLPKLEQWEIDDMNNIYPDWPIEKVLKWEEDSGIPQNSIRYIEYGHTGKRFLRDQEKE